MLAFALIADHVARRPWQIIAALGALVVGIASMTALITVDRAVRVDANLAVARISPDVNLQISATQPISDDLLRTVVRRPGIVAARPVIERPVTFETASSSTVEARFVGTDILSPIFIDEAARAALLPGPYSPRGTGPTPAELAVGSSVVIDERFRIRARVRIGDNVVARIGSTKRALRVIAVVHDDEMGASDPFVFADVGNAQRWFGLVGRIDRIDCVVDPEQLSYVDEALIRQLGSSVHVTEPVARTEHIIDSTRGIRFALQIIAVFAGILALLAAYNLFGTAVIQRRGEVATLRSLGVTRAEVLRTMVFEAAVYGICGSVFGLIVGVLIVGFNVSRVIAGADPLATDPPAVVDGQQTLVLMVSGILGTMAVATIPALRGLSREVLAARRDPFEQWRAPRVVRAAVALCIAVAVVSSSLARWTGDGMFLALGFAATAALGALASAPLMSYALGFLGSRAAHGGAIRIASSLAVAHRGRAFVAALPIVASVAALCVATVIVASDRATFDAATIALLGADRGAMQQAFDLIYALLGGAVLLLITVSAVAIGSVWFSALLERRATYATLRSLGMDERDVLISISWEVGMLAGLSVAIGVVVAAVDFVLIALSAIPAVAGAAVWLVPYAPISGWAATLFAVACLAAFPAARIVSRGALRPASGS